MVLPLCNIILEEVLPEDLILGHSYMIESNSFGHNNLKYKGILIENDKDHCVTSGLTASLFEIYESHPNTYPRRRFYCHSTRYYKSSKEQIADNQAQRTYINMETSRLIDKMTGRDVGNSVVYQFNNNILRSASEKIKTSTTLRSFERCKCYQCRRDPHNFIYFK